MTAVPLIAQRILDENKYTIADVSLVNCEYLIENATHYINLLADTAIAFTPATGVATLTATDDEIITTKILSTLMVRAFKERGPNISVSSISVSALITDPQYALYSKMFEEAITRLKGTGGALGLAFVVGSDDADLE
jgi:hypothetical protein